MLIQRMEEMLVAATLER